MKIDRAQHMKNQLNTAFDLVTASRFCEGVDCEDCPLKPAEGKCAKNKIQNQAKKGLEELALFIDANDKCSLNPEGGGGGPA